MQKYLQPELQSLLKADKKFQIKPIFELDFRTDSRSLKSIKTTRAVSR